MDWLPTHPSSAFVLPAASSPGTMKQLWWAPASVASLGHIGGSYNYSALQDVTPSLVTCCPFPAGSQTSLSSLSPTLPTVTCNPSALYHFLISIPGFIPHNPAYGNTSKEAFPPHCPAFTPHIHISLLPSQNLHESEKARGQRGWRAGTWAADTWGKAGALLVAAWSYSLSSHKTWLFLLRRGGPMPFPTYFIVLMGLQDLHWLLGQHFFLIHINIYSVKSYSVVNLKKLNDLPDW